MSEEPIPNSSRNGESNSAANPPNGAEDTISNLKREVEQLRVRLATVAAEAESYRQAAYALLNKQVPYVPPTEEELHDIIHGPRGRSILAIIAELERQGGG